MNPTPPGATTPEPALDDFRDLYEAASAGPAEQGFALPRNPQYHGGPTHYTIFTIAHPIYGHVVYVEITMLALDRWLKALETVLKYYPTVPLHVWLDELTVEGLSPEFAVIEETTDRSRIEHWLVYYRKLNPGLLNLSTDGYEQQAWLAQGIPDGFEIARRNELRERHRQAREAKAEARRTGRPLP